MAVRSPGDEADPGVLVSVLIPTLNEAAGIEEVARSLQEQRLEGDAEFLFIDGGSEDGTRQRLERLARDDPRIRLLDNPRRGIPFALNIGLAAARGEFIARMDAHTLYPQDYLARGIARLRRGDGVSWVSGPQIAVGIDRWSRRVALALGCRLGIGGARFRRLSDEFETDAGYTGVLRRETLAGHNGWNDGWEVNEDGELAARIRRSGGVIVCIPEMAASYIPRNSLSSLARQYWRYGAFRAKTCRAHPESMRPSHVLAPGLTVVALLAVAPWRGLRSAARTALRCYVLALLWTVLSRVRRAGVGDAASLPTVLATMHFAWGLGFLRGCLRFGPPLRALRLLLAPSRRRN